MLSIRRRFAALAILVLVSTATASPAAAAGTVKDGFYKGTASLFPLTFHVTGTGTKVTTFKLGYEITTCGPPGDPNKAPVYTFPKPMRISGGRFSGSYRTMNGPKELFTFKISGRFDGTKATGTGVATDKITSFHTCTEKFQIAAKLQ